MAPWLSKVHQVESNVKTMLTCFIFGKGIVHTDFVPPGKAVNHIFYLAILKCLQDTVRWKHLDLWQSLVWWWFPDNAPVYTTCETVFDQKWNDLTYTTHCIFIHLIFLPATIFLLPPPPHMKSVLKEKKFCWCRNGEENDECIKKHHFAKSSSTASNSDRRCLDWCIASNDEFFEGDKSINM